MKISAKSIVYFVVMVFLLVVCVIVYVDNQYDEALNAYEKQKESLLGIKEIENLEVGFKNNQSLDGCVTLLSKIYSVVGFYSAQKPYLKQQIDEFYSAKKKALLYGARCIQLGSDSTSMGWVVRYWMADVEAQEGNLMEAEKNLAIAFDLDKDGSLRSTDWIEKSALRGVYERMQLSRSQPASPGAK